jgi:hypothetical protein
VPPLDVEGELMRSRHLVTASAVVLTLALAGCSSAVSAAKSQVGNAVGAATCTAIADAKTRLATVGDADPATLAEISTAVTSIQGGLAALGDKVPAGLQDNLASAKQQLDTAIAESKVDPAKAKSALVDAGAKITSGLEQLGSSLGC